MDVILHIGAHRCASTTFQQYLRLNSKKLESSGIAVWGPRRTRNGLFHGLQGRSGVATGRGRQCRGIGRVQMNLARCADQARTLLVSDENILGSVFENLQTGTLYPGAGERLARFYQAFDGHVSDVVLNIRSLDSYWTSALGYGLTRGRSVPKSGDLDRLAETNRSWRDVIADVGCAMPGARLWVLPFETYGGRPDTQLRAVAAAHAPRSHARIWLNATPRLPQLREIVGPTQAARLPGGDGRWQPFAAAQIAAMRERYADDVMWLLAGGQGLARLMDDPDKKRAGLNLPLTDKTRGRSNDNQERRMEGAG